MSGWPAVLDAQIAAGATTAPEIVARHYEAAGLLAQAAAHYQVAANLAAERSGHREAIAFLRRGIDLARQLPDDMEGRELEVEMQLALGSSIATRSYSDPELAVAYDRARELCEHLGNDARVGQTLGGLSVFYINRGEIAEGAELAERVLTIADANHDDLLEVLGAVQLSLARSYQGRAAESLELATRALAVYQPERHQVLGYRFGTDQGVAAHVFAGWSHLVLGHLDRGLAQLVEAVDLADALGRPFNRVFALAFLATGHWERGETAETLHFAERGPPPCRGTGLLLLGRHQRRVGRGRACHHARRPRRSGRRVRGRVDGRGDGKSRRNAPRSSDESPRQHLPPAQLRRLRGSWTWGSRSQQRPVSPGGTRRSSGSRPSSCSTRSPPAPRTTCRTRLTRGPVLLRHGSRPSISPTGSAFRSTGPAPPTAMPVSSSRWERVEEGRRLLDDWYGRCTEGLDTPVLTAVRNRMEKFRLLI